MNIVQNVKEPGYSRIYEKFGIEAELFVDTELGLLKNPDDIIKEIDFLPIVLRHETTETGDKVSYLTMSLIEKKEADGSQRIYRRINLNTDDNNSMEIGGSTINSDASKHVINDLLVLRDTGSIYPLIMALFVLLKTELYYKDLK